MVRWLAASRRLTWTRPDSRLETQSDAPRRPAAPPHPLPALGCLPGMGAAGVGAPPSPPKLGGSRGGGWRRPARQGPGPHLGARGALEDFEVRVQQSPMFYSNLRNSWHIALKILDLQRDRTLFLGGIGLGGWRPPGGPGRGRPEGEPSDVTMRHLPSGPSDTPRRNAITNPCPSDDNAGFRRLWPSSLQNDHCWLRMHDFVR